MQVGFHFIEKITPWSTRVPVSVAIESCPQVWFEFQQGLHMYICVRTNVRVHITPRFQVFSPKLLSALWRCGRCSFCVAMLGLLLVSSWNGLCFTSGSDLVGQKRVECQQAMMGRVPYSSTACETVHSVQRIQLVNLRGCEGQ